MRWLIMSHLIKIYAVCKFSYLRLWYLKRYTSSVLYCIPPSCSYATKQGHCGRLCKNRKKKRWQVMFSSVLLHGADSRISQVHPFTCILKTTYHTFYSLKCVGRYWVTPIIGVVWPLWSSWADNGPQWSPLWYMTTVEMFLSWCH